MEPKHGTALWTCGRAVQQGSMWHVAAGWGRTESALPGQTVTSAGATKVSLGFLCSGPGPECPLCTSPQHPPELNASLIPFCRWGGGGLCIPELVSGAGPGAGAVSDLSQSPAPCPCAWLRRCSSHSLNASYFGELFQWLTCNMPDIIWNINRTQ